MPLSPEQQARTAKISRDPITLKPVTSSQIAAIGHDAATNTLAVQFLPRSDEREGSVYHYADVDAAIYKDFSEAPSLGSYFYRHIKPDAARFPYLKVREAVKREPEAA
jgi:hypothetical protein